MKISIKSYFSIKLKFVAKLIFLNLNYNFKSCFSVCEYPWSSAGFSTCGLRTPKQFTGGTQNYKSNSKENYMDRIFDLGVCKEVYFLFRGAQMGTFLIWGM